MGNDAGTSAANAPRCPTRTRLYRTGRVLADGFPPEELSGRLAADADSVVWLDLYHPTETDLRIVVDEFGLHPLAVEDAIQPQQRPKVDRYQTYSFVNVYAVAVGDGTTTLASSEISFFIMDRGLVTIRKNEFDIDTVIRRWDLNADLIDAANQVGSLVYGLVDVIVDGQYEAVERLHDAIDELHDNLFGSYTGAAIRRRAYELGTAIAALRRIVEPMHEVVSRLMRDSHLADDTLAPYYHDVYDHVLRTAEAVAAAHDRVDRIADLQLNEQGAQLNEITKKLAAWAAIIAVPTAVTGFYGQNVPFPGFGRVGGFISSCVVMVTLATLVYWYLRRNRWL